MPRRLAITAFAFAAMAAIVLGAGLALSPQAAGLPEAITAASACPVAGCTQPDGACHTSGPYPQPDGSFTMVCPHVKGCAEASCHAFERIALAGHPSDASLNLWIILPTLLALGLVLLVRRLA
jgi:hypothetical protein